LRAKYLQRKPKHIVLIFLESHSAWLSSYKIDRSNQLIGKNLEQIKKHSISFSNFFQAGSGTLDNLIKINLSIPTKKNFRITFPSEVFKPFPDTLPRTLERQGYRSHFFYGGSLSWHRLYSRMSKLGYHQIFGESFINNVQKSRFGVHDGNLFEYVNQMLMQAKNPTFSFILTLSNHPPYSVPETFMSPVNSSNVPPNLKEKILDEENFYKRMRAFTYVDQALGLFLEKAKQQSYFRETLFLITADHAHKMNLKWKPEEYYKQRRIPLLIYAPAMLKKTNEVIENYGSHLDILPTILSLILDKPVEIHSWGRSLIEAPKKKFLFSHNINCLDGFCLANDRVYILKKDKNLKLCKDKLCFKKSEKIAGILEAFWNSGLNYLFQYRIMDMQ